MKSNSNRHWAKLDNAAKIFPANSSERDGNVFRFCCEMKEVIDPDILQTALDQTLAVFPFFRVILRRGFFWPYLEESELPAKVHPEDRPPCSPLYDPDVKRLLFDISYFDRRINFEVFHALTDGTGALQFLQRLVYHYIIIRYDYDPNQVEPLPYSASYEEKQEDSFAKHYHNEKNKTKKPKQKRIVAYREKYPLLPEARIAVIEGHISTSAALKIAKAHGVSLTVYLCATLLCAYHETRRHSDRSHPVVLAVPVNLRQFFPSDTARNFFSLIYIRYYFTDDTVDFDDILRSVSEQFQAQLTKENLSDRLNTLMQFEQNPFVRIVPLPIKNWGLKLGKRWADRERTSTISNIGRVQMPSFCSQYIQGFDVFVSTEERQLCLCSFEDHLTLSFSSSFASTEIPMLFFRSLSKAGLSVSIGASMRDDQTDARIWVNNAQNTAPSPQKDIQSSNIHETNNTHIRGNI